MSIVAGTAQVRPITFSSAVFIAALIYWSIWVAIGVIFGPSVRRIIGPAYIEYVFIVLPVLFIGLFLFRYLRARGRMRAV